MLERIIIATNEPRHNHKLNILERTARKGRRCTDKVLAGQGIILTRIKDLNFDKRFG